MITAATDTNPTLPAATQVALGRQIAIARRELGWTQERLAKEAGNLNRETIMRIEGGGDTRGTTLAKIKQVLPGLDGYSRRERQREDFETMQLEDFATRIGHLVQGITSVERLHKIRAFVLSQLIDEQHDLDPASIAHLQTKQEDAEKRLVARAQKDRRSKRSTAGRTDGKANGH